MSQSGSYVVGAFIPTLPVTVPEGGTGEISLTDHGVLVGSGVADITALAVGVTGTLLVGTVASDPAFGTSATGDFTFTSSTASQTRILTVTNTDNTGAATSAARLDLTVGGANVADPQLKYTVTGAGVFSSGIDNSDSDKFKISASDALGTTDVFVSTTSGEITKPLQPAFLSYLATTDSDATGNGTVFQLGSGNALTEVYDQNEDFNVNGTFTAPVSGCYLLSGAARCQQLFSNHISVLIQFVTSNGTYAPLLFNGATVRSTSDASIPIVSQVDMDAADTAVMEIIISGGAKSVDIGATGRATTFAGQLLC